MKSPKRILTLVCAFVLCTACLAGCKKEDTQNNPNHNMLGNVDSVDSEVLENTYGAVMKMDSSQSVPIQYDSRFLTEEQAKLVSDYFYSMAVADEDLYRKCVLPEYIGFLESIMKDGRTLKTSMDSTVKGLKIQLGGNYEFSICDVVDGTKTTLAESIPDLLDSLDEIATADDSSAKTVTEKTSGTKAIELVCDVTITATGKSEDSSGAEISDSSESVAPTEAAPKTEKMSGNKIYVVEVDGTSYIIPYPYE